MPAWVMFASFFCFYEQLSFHAQVSWNISVAGMKESILQPKASCPVIFWTNMSTEISGLFFFQNKVNPFKFKWLWIHAAFLWDVRQSREMSSSAVFTHCWQNYDTHIPVCACVSMCVSVCVWACVCVCERESSFFSDCQLCMLLIFKFLKSAEFPHFSVPFIHWHIQLYLLLKQTPNSGQTLNSILSGSSGQAHYSHPHIFHRAWRSSPWLQSPSTY